MDPIFFIVVLLLVGTAALAFYMDWLGLWVSKAEMQEQVERSKERMQPNSSPIASDHSQLNA